MESLSMFGRSVLLVLTVPRVNAAFHAGSHLFLASIGSFVTFSVDTSTTRASGPFTTLSISFLYGAGAALTLDEFALWLNSKISIATARACQHRRHHFVRKPCC